MLGSSVLLFEVSMISSDEKRRAVEEMIARVAEIQRKSWKNAHVSSPNWLVMHWRYTTPQSYPQVRHTIQSYTD